MGIAWPGKGQGGFRQNESGRKKQVTEHFFYVSCN